MLKGKNSLYILLPINLFIWGYIGLKIYSALNEGEGFIPQEFSISKSKLTNNDTIDYKLSLNYKDPFLKEEYNYNKVINATSGNQRPIQHNNNNALTTSKEKDIKFLGLIENKSNGIITALISINGNSFIVKKGQIIDDLLIKNITEKELLVKDKKNTLVIRR
ncbi:MAG: hypothetical protein JNK50_01055 [Bacteroidia bacterium]|nr:hypothetical protein [Bacteroidia bacterium]